MRRFTLSVGEPPVLMLISVGAPSKRAYRGLEVNQTVPIILVYLRCTQEDTAEENERNTSENQVQLNAQAEPYADREGNCTEQEKTRSDDIPPLAKREPVAEYR